MAKVSDTSSGPLLSGSSSIRMWKANSFASASAWSSNSCFRSSSDIREVFASVWKRVTAMVEPAACVGGADAVEGGRKGGFERLGSAPPGGPQGALELGPAGFDGREIGRIAPQIEELEPASVRTVSTAFGLCAAKLSTNTVALGW